MMRTSKWMSLRMLISNLTGPEKTYFVNSTNAIIESQQKKSSRLLSTFHSLDCGKEIPLNLQDKDRKVLESLEGRVLDSLLSDVNVYRQGDRPRPAIQVSKLLLKAELLYERGIYHRSYEMLEICIKKACKIERFDIAIRATESQLKLIPLYSDVELYQQKKMELSNYTFRQNAKSEIVNFYHTYLLKKYLNASENIDVYLISSLDRINKMLNREELIHAQFVATYFRQELQKFKGDYDGALLLSCELHFLIKTNSFLTNHYNVSAAAYDRGSIKQRLDPIESKRYYHLCMRLCSPESFFYQHSLLQLAIVEFQSEFDKTPELIRFFCQSRFFQGIPSRNRAKWRFASAIISFVDGDYVKCGEKLTAAQNEGIPDKNFNAVVRLVHVICFLERELFDIADRELEAMRKFISRHRAKHNLQQCGLKYFYHFLREFKNNGYQYRPTRHRDLLTSAIDELSKKHLTRCVFLELTPFAHWIKNTEILENWTRFGKSKVL